MAKQNHTLNSATTHPRLGTGARGTGKQCCGDEFDGLGENVLPFTVMAARGQPMKATSAQAVGSAGSPKAPSAVDVSGDLDVHMSNAHGLARALRILLSHASMEDDFDRAAAADLARAVEDQMWSACTLYDKDWTPEGSLTRKS